MENRCPQMSRLFDVPDGRTLVVDITPDSVRLSFKDQPERVLELPTQLAKEIGNAIGGGDPPDPAPEVDRRCRSPFGMKARR